MWFLHEASRLFIWTGAKRGWVRNIGRQPQVAVTIAENQPPFAAAIVRGVAAVQVDRTDAADIIRRITAEYIAAPDVDAYITRFSGLTTIIEITITSQVDWGRCY